MKRQSNLEKLQRLRNPDPPHEFLKAWKIPGTTTCESELNTSELWHEFDAWWCQEVGQAISTGSGVLRLDRKARKTRERLRISPRGEVLFRGTLSVWPDNDIVVEADGLGSATLLVVEGNYPVDYLTRREQRFASEDDACEAAEKLLS